MAPSDYGPKVGRHAACQLGVGKPQEATCLYGVRFKKKKSEENIMSNTNQTYLESLTWDKVEWRQSYRHVRSIQKRIFKSSKLGDKGKMRFLQKLLIRNPHAKLIAVHQVTTLNKGKRTAGIDNVLLTTGKEKMELARSIHLNGNATMVQRVWIPKSGKTEKRPLGIPTIRDRAKQALAKMALEPEWEAKFEAISYGFRPGRNSHDAVEAIFQHLHFNVDKYVFDADIRKCFDRIDHQALLAKLDTFPLMERQIEAWLKAGIVDAYANTYKTSVPTAGTPQGGIISPLLANIALHGLEDHLVAFVTARDFPKPHEGAARGKRAKASALGIVRYADDFVIIHRNRDILERVMNATKEWLGDIGLEISEEKSRVRLASQSFTFLGFRFTSIKQGSRYRTKIVPDNENIRIVTNKTRKTIQTHKAISSYDMVERLRPILIGWGNYFQYCECKEAFRKVDNIVYQQLRAWVFRRATRQGRICVKENYFPSGKVYTYQGRTYKANWVLCGKKKVKPGEIRTNYLPKVSWIASKKYVKVAGRHSVFDEDTMYWVNRNTKYLTISTRVQNLLKRQKGKCALCHGTFVSSDHMEVDHVCPKIHGGQDTYDNLQLLHRHCHVKKTQQDRTSSGKGYNLKQEPDEGKTFTSGSEDESSCK